ncbi:MAG: hypothetical protein JRI93_10265 [Deltaproteobacteria bacterium]|nr:hypothetical protein [Deltaproteobacteria bacterium]MBW2176814.1 hypothetical protein [Deltaproteobacteria bacterium]
MLDIATAYNRYKFLGYEFLTWLWFAIERNPGLLKSENGDFGAINVGNRIVLENFTRDKTESITIKGDDPNLDAALLSLKNGALVTEINLVFKSNDHEWQFTLKGESFSITNLKTPQRGPVDTIEDTEGAVLEQAYLLDQLLQYQDSLFKTFIHLRVSPEWQTKSIPELKSWASAQ